MSRDAAFIDFFKLYLEKTVQLEVPLHTIAENIAGFERYVLTGSFCRPRPVHNRKDDCNEQ